ncbi:MAG: fasciclin domain-containing protein [Paludibacter sp.]|jgi:uncharacterized surface protein with fasciclin (FAS1) repeats|nr:fasciclin domain-containing protein [Paludibacter sp.]
MKHTVLKRVFYSCVFALTALAFVQCNDEKEKYYERPEWLEPPVYQVLEQKGNFTKYLQCVDRTDYAKALKGAGLYTVFAPNDAAFTAFLKDNGYATVADIPAETVRQLVAYSIVYSVWKIEHLGDKFVNQLYEPGAFKRKTNLYKLPYRDAEYDNKWVYDEIRNGVTVYNTINYQTLLMLQNYKYLPVFTDAFLNSFLPQHLTANDYKTFFPNSEYTGRNVQAGTIITADIPAENGVIHEVSTVSLPLDNQAEILKRNEFSAFKSLLEFQNPDNTYAFKDYRDVSIDAPQGYLDMFKKMLPNEPIDNVYVKSYSNGGIALSPLAENIFNPATGNLNTESSGNTMFIPQNDVLQEYIQQRLLKYYGDINKLPSTIIETLINTHMVEGLIWPQFYKGSINYTGEYLNGTGTAGKDFDADGIISKTIASNGFVYGIDHVIKSRFFETVYSEIFLNPAHTLLDRAYTRYFQNGREELCRSVLNGYTSERWTMLNFSDNLLTKDGFKWDDVNSTFAHDYCPSSLIDGRMLRLMRMHTFPGINNAEINSEIKSFDDLPLITATGGYGGWRYFCNLYGDVVRYKDKQMQAAGNIEDGTVVNLTVQEGEYNNGQIFNVDKLLDYAPRNSTTDDARFKDLTLWQYLKRAKAENPTVGLFIDYVEKCLKSADSDDLAGIKAENFYTVLMPNDAAMNQAISRGLIRALDKITEYEKDSLGNTTTTENQAGTAENLARITNFINSHFLQGQVLPDDGLYYIYPVNINSPDKALVPTLLKITDEKLGLTNARTLIEITKAGTGSTPAVLNFKATNIDVNGRTAVTGAANPTTGTAIRVQRGVITGTQNYRSNRIACKAILHEINGYFTFTLNK